MKKSLVFSHIGYSVLAAVLYCVPMIIFVHQENFRSTWWLYVGNILFGVGISLFMLRHIQVKKQGGSTTSMVSAGHVVSFVGIVISCLVVLLALLILVPGVFGSGTPDKVLETAPSQMQDGKTNGLVMILFMDAIFGNIIAGSFASVIFAYSAKLNQTRDKESELLKEKPGRW